MQGADRSDLIVFVTDVRRRLLDESERVFLRKYRHVPCIVVVNGMDTISESESRQAIEEVAAELAAIQASSKAAIVPAAAARGAPTRNG
jgi:predicted GTPase